jgi:protein-disulfide isomerase
MPQGSSIHDTTPPTPRQKSSGIGRPSMFAASLALTFFALGGLIAYLAGLSLFPSGETPMTPFITVITDPSAYNLPVPYAGHNPAIGPADAAITLAEYADYRCEYCKNFHDTTLKMLMAKYGGQLRYVYYDFPSAGGQQAAEAASCADDQGAYWAYHDALFANPADHANIDQFVGLAGSLGLDTAAFYDCLSSGEHHDAVAQDYQAGLSAGVRGTPTFFVRGTQSNSIRLIGAQPLPVFENAIDPLKLSSAERYFIIIPPT